MTDKTNFMKIALAQSKDMVGKPAPIVPFYDWDYYYTLGEVSWVPSAGSEIKFSVEVPKGFVTDLASVPRIFWSILPPAARYSYAAIVHDYLYWEQPCDQETADLILKEAMNDLGVSMIDSFAIYNGVRVGGASAWKANGRAKDGGEKRILKKFPENLTTTWAEWKKFPENFV